MGAVFKRELSSAFHRLYGYVTVSATFLIVAVFFTVYNLNYTSDTIVTALSAVYIPVALIIPVIAVNAFPNKRGADTDGAYDILPLSFRRVAMGKILAALTLAHLPTLAMALLPLISGSVAPQDHGVSYSALVGLALFETAWLSVCMFIASLAKSKTRAFVWCYVSAVAMFLASTLNTLLPRSPILSVVFFALVGLGIGAIVYVLTKNIVATAVFAAAAELLNVLGFVLRRGSYEGLVETFIDKLSLFRRLDVFFGGIFDLESVWFFLVVSLLFFFLVYRAYAKRGGDSGRDGVRIKSSVSVMLAIVIATLSCLSCVGAAVVPDRYVTADATGAKKFSVSDVAREFLSNIDKEVTIYHLEPSEVSSLAVSANGYSLYLEKLAACGKNIRVEKAYYDSNSELYEKYQLDPTVVNANSLLIECGDNAQYLDFVNMLGYSNDTLGMTNATYSEYQYYGAIFSQSADYEQYLYSLLTETYLTFNGDAAICEYIEYVTADIIPKSYHLTGHGERDASLATDAYYGIGLLPLDVSAAEVPADAASVLINMPTEDISDGELERLLTYLERGGQLTVLTDKISSGFKNLGALMAAYGMSASEEVLKVIPKSETSEDNADAEEGEQTDAAETTDSLEPVSSFTPDVNCDNDVLTYLDGTTLAFEMTDANAIILNGDAEPTLIHHRLMTVDSSDDTYTVACAAETADGGRVVWFTAAEAFNNASTNARLAVAFPLLYWVTLTYSSQLGAISPVIYQTPVGAASGMGAAISATALIVLPIALAVFGVIAFYRRKKAR